MNKNTETNIESKNDIIVEDDDRELKLPPWQAHLWFLAICLMMVVDQIDRWSISVCLPYIKKEYFLTDAQAGLIGTAFSLSVAIFCVPIATLAHKWSRRKVLAITIAFWSIATWTTGLVKSYGGTLMARFGLGVGEAAYIPVTYTLVTAWYSKKYRGLVMGIYYAVGLVGGSIGLSLSGYLASKYGWRSCFGILAIPGLILAVIAWFIPDYRNKMSFKVDKMEELVNARSKSLKIGISDAFLYVLKSPVILCSFLISAAFIFGSSAISLWGVTTFNRIYGMKVTDAANFIAVIAIVSAAGPALLGYMADLICRKSKRGRIIASVIITLGLFIALALFSYNSIYSKNLVIAFLTFGCAKIFIAGGLSNINTLTADLLPIYYRSVGTSFVPVANQGIGGTLGPVVCGICSDMVGLAVAWGIIGCVSLVIMLVLAAICWVSYERTYRQYQNMPEIDLEIDK